VLVEMPASASCSAFNFPSLGSCICPFPRPTLWPFSRSRPISPIRPFRGNGGRLGPFALLRKAIVQDDRKRDPERQESRVTRYFVRFQRGSPILGQVSPIEKPGKSLIRTSVRARHFRVSLPGILHSGKGAWLFPPGHDSSGCPRHRKQNTRCRHGAPL
jgi:hypothetical protein